MSQTERLYNLLSDCEPHSTIEIMREVYGSDHLGLARCGARVWDIKKKYGVNIEGWKDKQNKTILVSYNRAKLNKLPYKRFKIRKGI